MIKILKGESVSKLDALHCEVSGQPGLDLMEQAAESFVVWFLEKFSDRKFKIGIFCGAGNNGGDGFAIGRLLSEKGFEVKIIKCFLPGAELSEDAQTNVDQLSEKVDSEFFSSELLPLKSDVILDAYLGVGLKGDLREPAKEIIRFMNESVGIKIAVDIPSGLPADCPASTMAFQADYTVTFAFPKLSLLLPENAQYCGELVLRDIGILPEIYHEFESNFYFLNSEDIPRLHRRFHRFSHKGDFGKVLLIGGSPRKMGALYLSAKSALRTGAGLVTCFLDESERMTLQSSLPEAMCLWGAFPKLNQFDSIGIGPGWGVILRKHFLEDIFDQVSSPLVLDADAINILVENTHMLELLPQNTILTPHPGEFDRLLGKSKNHVDRIAKARDFVLTHQVILILKGANTLVSLPDGRQIFNSTGSNYMATGGSGDVLTGMITAYLGMGYHPENAALCGVYHHGLAGELAGSKTRRGTLASDLIAHIPDTYFRLGIE